MKFCVFSTAIVITIFLSACKKEDVRQIPTVTTSAVTIIADTAIIAGGTITLMGQTNVSDRGVCWDTLPNPTIGKLKTSDGDGIGNFISTIKTFLPNTKYYIRAYASNSFGTAYGEEKTFTTNQSAPRVSTGLATSITSTSALISCKIIHDGGVTIISSGICWSVNPNPTISDNKIILSSYSKEFNCILTELAFYKKYYARAFAENSLGITYGTQISFNTYSEITVTDIDGNKYNTAVIGNQVWMLENLKVLRYRNGSPVTYTPNGTTWDAMKTGAYCYYNNDTANKKLYGVLYNGYAVLDSRKLAPEGWHVATSSEWNALYTYLCGNDLNADRKLVAGKLKAYGAEFDQQYNAYATNESNFTAIPNGMRFDSNSGHFQGINGGAFFWCGNPCTSCSNGDYAHSVWLSEFCNFYVDELARGFGVRCVKD